jgi:sugar lactone lactonase YvrE
MAVAIGQAWWSTPVGAQEGAEASLYGALGEPDANGVRLPEGFSSRVIATTGEVVPGTEYQWHLNPDGGACFATDDGGWVYVSNSEAINNSGGVGAVRFDPDGGTVGAYRILDGTNGNCAGGPTPWGTWLSCEEYDLHGLDPEIAEAAGSIAGRVWECDPLQAGQGEVRPAMGSFQHEAAAVDPDGQAVYLTEDRPEGLFYRFTPAAYPDLSEGLLEAALVDGGTLTWVAVPDPAAAEEPPSDQLGDAVTRFPGGEGIWFHDGVVYFTTKGDNRVHKYEPRSGTYEVIYDAAELGDDATLKGVDNITVEEGSGDLFVAEDGDDMELVLITADGAVAPFLQVIGHDGSEVTGPAFSPDGTRLYFSSQRGIDGAGTGMTFEVTGPFRGVELRSEGTTTTAPAPGDTLQTATTGGGGASEEAAAGDGGGDDPPVALIVGGVAVVGAAAAAGVVALRNRGAGADPESR